MKTVFKFLMVALGLILIATTLTVLILFARADDWSKPAIEQTMTRIYGVPTQIDRVSFSPLQESVELHGLRISNPEEFESTDAIECGHVLIQVDSQSMFTGSPTIRLIRLDDVTMKFRHELGAGANLLQLIDHARGQPNADDGENRKIAIEKLEFTGGTLQASSGIIPGGAELEIAPFTIEDVGGENRLAPADAGATVLSAVLRETVAGGAAFRPIADALKDAFTNDEP